MGVFNLFSRRSGFDPDLFERELAALTEQIGTVQLQITALVRSARGYRWSLLQISVAVYIAALAWLYGLSPARQSNKGSALMTFASLLNATQWLFIGLFPIAAFALSVLMGRAFDMLIRKRRAALAALKKKHHAKIDELKEITNFNKTSRLLLKFDDEQATPKADLKQQSKARLQIQPQQHALPRANEKAFDARTLSPKQQQEIAKLNLSFVNGQNPSLTSAPTTRGVTSGFAQNPSSKREPLTPKQPPFSKQNPHTKTVQDRILDLLIGSSGSEAVEDRYALICNMCFTHNGLAPPNTADPASVKYVCRKCGHMNGVKLWEQMNPPEMKGEPLGGENPVHDAENDTRTVETPTAKGDEEQPACESKSP